jgi:hypothetical protein
MNKLSKYTRNAEKHGPAAAKESRGPSATPQPIRSRYLIAKQLATQRHF